MNQIKLLLVSVSVSLLLPHIVTAQGESTSLLYTCQEYIVKNLHDYRPTNLKAYTTFHLTEVYS